MPNMSNLKMWTAWELSELQGTLRDIKLEDVLTEDEIMVIKDNSTRYMNLKNEIKVPKHKDKVNFCLARLIIYSNLRLKRFC